MDEVILVNTIGKRKQGRFIVEIVFGKGYHYAGIIPEHVKIVNEPAGKLKRVAGIIQEPVKFNQ